MVNTLNENDYAPFQKKYIDSFEGDVFELLAKQKESFTTFIDSLDNEQLNYSYADDKWTLRQVIIHIIDTEAIFNYRALCISRGDKQVLAGFDQDEYMDNMIIDKFNKEYLINYFTITRYNCLILINSFTDEQWEWEGKINDYTMKLKVFPHMNAGHLEHHWKIIQERYISS